MEILQNLNEEQKKAVVHQEGPILILAGAGSGKTRVLTHRIAYLIYQYDVAPTNILAVTFTNKAAAEMKERIANLVTTASDSIWISTFHSSCVRILRREITKLDYESNFVIFDTSDQKTLVKNILQELDLDPKNFKPRAILGRISQAKNKLITPQDYQATDYFSQVVEEVYPCYQARLKENNALDFGDLIMKTVQLFRKYPAVLDYYQEKFKYILVDEYQDVNHAQYQLINLLAAKHNNICVVGDDDQSIYRFRGADITNILNFENDYPKAEVIKLEQNYRSTQNILTAAFSVISNNPQRKAKKLWTENPEGEPLALHQAKTGHQEADYIAQEILKLEQEGYSWHDIAILYRTNAQSRRLEQTLIRKEIPYRMIGGLKFYDRKEIKDILAYLRLIYNPADDISLQRVINIPKRGIGKTTLARLQEFATQEEISLLEAVKRVEEIDSISARFSNKVRAFGELITDLQHRQPKLSVANLTQELLEQTGYLAQLKAAGTEQAESRIDNLNELLASMEEFGEEAGALGSFLEEVALVADVDNLDEEADGVVLMTLHSAKGLEFPIVFLAGMEEELFPHSRSLAEEGGIAEERRLCYVGITRAEEKLYLTHAKRRKVYGQTKYNSPSRFISEISNSLFQQNEVSRVERSQFGPGDKVVHKQWGQGEVRDIIAEHGREKIVVFFKEVGVKELAAEYAKLTKIN
ncbi:DNA helicase PcrA [Natroniella sulfidigena]|uniref:DNA helicase PcrA n=1 Tax=Natroniella sulfidigena TaxID=723921 RepID=UPI002009F84C|nr:DNA helicase PcrA [Natroniella sulfidigena]MCK8816070.1 DNA helicase PcrA [Natroniella sulfidigena]